MITQLIEYWREQGIVMTKRSKQEIVEIQKGNSLDLPIDFIEFYLNVNGMETFYPNEIDKEGFLFYPLEAVISVRNEFEDTDMPNKESIYLFAEYMHKRWWYGVRVINDWDYMIGIIPTEHSFQPITNSLSDFIKLYMDDSPKLYDFL